MTNNLTCFKSYDIRGELNINFDGDICYRIGRAFASFLKAKKVIVGRDARESSTSLLDCICQGLIEEGVEVLDIGLAGTEEMYWATTQYRASGGIEVTASHNPINFNGLKLVKSGSKPLGGAELLSIKRLAEKNLFSPFQSLGTREDISAVSKEKYVAKVLSFVNPTSFKSFKIVINCGNGAAGPTFDAIASELSGVNSKLRFERINHEVDSSFPNGIPNPLLAENHYQNRKKVLETKADLGVAFDGDFDRCFFFDERGEFVPSQYVVGLLAEIFLIREPGATIVHDPRVIWNIQDIISNNNGVPVVSLTGHSFVKRAMRDHCAVYGGEISAHHYFKEFCYCDSGMIPWLLVVELMSNSGKSLSELVSVQRLKYPTSGELNFNIEQVDKTLRKVVAFYEPNCIQKDHFDGISLSFESWRLNIRRSNTESVVRVNIESRGDPDLINRKIEEIRTIMLS